MTTNATQRLYAPKKDFICSRNCIIKSLNSSDMNKIPDHTKCFNAVNNLTNIPNIVKDKGDGNLSKKFIAPLPLISKSTLFDKKLKTVLAQREAEYDKNLKSIKFNKPGLGTILSLRENNGKLNKLKPAMGISSNLNTPRINNQQQVNKKFQFLNRDRSRNITANKEFEKTINMKTTPSDVDTSFLNTENNISHIEDIVKNKTFCGETSDAVPISQLELESKPVGSINIANVKLLESKKKEFIDIDEKIINTTIKLNQRDNEQNTNKTINEESTLISDIKKNSSNTINSINTINAIPSTNINANFNKNTINGNNINLTINNSLDLIINNASDEDLLLDKDNHLDVEIYMKDELIFNRCNSEMPIINNLTSNISKSNASHASNASRVHIQHQYEYSIPLNNINNSEAINSNSSRIIHKKINIPTNITSMQMQPNLNFIQENINKINLGIFTANYENIKTNKESVAKFSQEEYRKVLTTYLRYEYGKNILEEFFTEEEVNEKFLSGHELTERMRMRMIDWMIEVLTNYKCEENTFFIAVNIMDRFFKNCSQQLRPDDLHLVGVCSMFLASKFYDVYPMKLKLIVEKVAHNKFTPDEVKNMEENIVKTLNYELLKPTSYDFINFFFEEIFFFIENNFTITDEILSDYFKHLFSSYGVEVKLDNYYEKYKNTKKFTSNMLNLLKHVVLYLAKMNCHDYSLIAIKPSLLAASSIFVGIKICEQINSEEYINHFILKKICEISRQKEYEILFYAQKILHNAQNFESIFHNLENLKKVHFNYILELKETK